MQDGDNGDETYLVLFRVLVIVRLLVTGIVIAGVSDKAEFVSWTYRSGKD